VSVFGPIEQLPRACLQTECSDLLRTTICGLLGHCGVMTGEAVAGLIMVVAGARRSDVQCVADGDIVKRVLKDREICPLPTP